MHVWTFLNPHLHPITSHLALECGPNDGCYWHISNGLAKTNRKEGYSSQPTAQQLRQAFWAQESEALRTCTPSTARQTCAVCMPFLAAETSGSQQPFTAVVAAVPVPPSSTQNLGHQNHSHHLLANKKFTNMQARLVTWTSLGMIFEKLSALATVFSSFPTIQWGKKGQHFEAPFFRGYTIAIIIAHAPGAHMPSAGPWPYSKCSKTVEFGCWCWEFETLSARDRHWRNSRKHF